MGQKIIWSKVALKDVESIHDYISIHSALQATRQVDRIFDRTEILRNSPASGRIVPEFNIANLRELIEGSYRIIYRIETDDDIGIVRVHHSARLLTSL